jgi:DNA-binding transcriptional MerR regulator
MAPGKEGNYSLVTAAQRLGVSPHTLRFWTVYRGLVPHVRLGRRIVFRPADLEEFERRNLVAARAGW